MEKIDFKHELKQLYHASAKAVVEVDVPRLRFLMVDGAGDPNTSPAYASAVEALYASSWAVKFAAKKAQGIDYVVMPLEGLWWSGDMGAFASGDRAKWRWTMMILQPDVVDEATILAGIAQAERKRPIPAASRPRLESFEEGRCAQVLHVGPYREEGPTIERVHAFIRERAVLAGRHHEIYLGDPRRTAPARLRTILRQPMA
ncbi:GyrI-like domain-containing protein [Luteimonas saliphila]|uniref:GyrI-like domain-containing protein n=1 Tax=Luteimonas saliphila TaxID=2804919 RepID=UPI00192D5D7F|nr:GyrI-like domain-containing protein [Luteimonas saliphila]